MKGLVFDTGPIISLTLNNLLWLVDPLREHFNGNFYITPGVYYEAVQKPLETRKYKFEALQVLPLITNKTFAMIDDAAVKRKAEHLLDLANHTFKAHEHWITIVHPTEMEAVAATAHFKYDAVVIDERTTRMLIENPASIASHLQKRLHTDIKINQNNLHALQQELQHIKVIRSFELAAIAYELGLFDRYLSPASQQRVPGLRRKLIEGVLWGIKLHGCSVREEEIDEIVRMER